MNYIVKMEYRENWNTMNDLGDDSKWIVDEKEIERLAKGWGVPVEELMEQVEAYEA